MTPGKKMAEPGPDRLRIMFPSCSSILLVQSQLGVSRLSSSMIWAGICCRYYCAVLPFFFVWRNSVPIARMLCLPHAGAGPSTFFAWRDVAPDGVEIVPVSLPGRERRVSEEPYVNLHEAVKGITDELRPILSDGTPLVLFGHCLGALLAYELARSLCAAETPVAPLPVSGT